MIDGLDGVAVDRVAVPQSRRFRPGAVAAWVVVPAVLAGLVLAQGRALREASCETYDEFTYLRMGVCIFRHNDFASLASPMTPPLPILLEYWLPALSARALPDTPGWEEEVPRLTKQARLLTSLCIGVPLVWVVYAWLASRRGWPAGLLGGGLAALSPTVLAAASIATTDACFALFSLVALALFRRYQDRPSRATYAGLGLGLGLALGAKQTAVVLLPVACVELFLKLPPVEEGRTRVDACLLTVYRMGVKTAGLVGLTFLVDWALYRFGFAPPFWTGADHVSIPAELIMLGSLVADPHVVDEFLRRFGPPLPIDTFFGQLDHATKLGHPAFLMGMHSVSGWWYFFPVAIAVKSTPTELFLFAASAVAALRPASWRDPARRIWLLALGSLLSAGLLSKINIGQRYMLLAYPLVILIAVDLLAEVGGRRRWASALGLALLAGQGVSAAGIAPHYLAYFNSFCGGPAEGHRYLVDSSLDWGQGLPALRKELEARGYHKVALAYFGTAKPDAYGLRSMDWRGFDDPVAAGCDWLAISATRLEGGYGSSSTLADRFKGLHSAQPGYCMFLYDLNDPRVREAFYEVNRDAWFALKGLDDGRGPEPGAGAAPP